MTAGLALRYAAFAGIAILANLGAQRLVLGWAGGGLPAAMIAGTTLGLLVKYLLDRRWIFGDRTIGIRAHGRCFSLYTATGGLTTLLFWAVEAGFWRIGQTDTARELGAFLGLSLGYGIKYVLDRRFVFADAPAGRTA